MVTHHCTEEVIRYNNTSSRSFLKVNTVVRGPNPSNHEALHFTLLRALSQYLLKTYRKRILFLGRSIFVILAERATMSKQTI